MLRSGRAGRLGRPLWSLRGARTDPLLDAMAGYGFSDQEVALALIGFKGAAELTLLDSWAVRRPLSLPDLPGAFFGTTAPRRIATGRAMLAQFQAHLADLRAANVPVLKARTHFPLLPPVGILPGTGVAEAKDFLGGMTVRGPIHINSATVEQLIRESLAFPAIRSTGNEVIWLYSVAENLIAGREGDGGHRQTGSVRPLLSANIAFRGDARFNLHRWNYANYALGSG